MEHADDSRRLKKLNKKNLMTRRVFGFTGFPPSWMKLVENTVIVNRNERPPLGHSIEKYDTLAR